MYIRWYNGNIFKSIFLEYSNYIIAVEKLVSGHKSEDIF